MDHGHKHFHNMLAIRAPDVTTVDGVVMSVVYVTADATFSGDIGGYTTLNGDDSNTAAAAAAAVAATSSNYVLPAPTVADSTQAAVATSPSSAFSSSVAESSLAASSNGALSSDTTLRTSAGTYRASNTAVAGAAETSSSSSSATASSSDAGMSTGAKAGLAIGIIAIVGIIAALLLWFFGKKKREKEENSRADNEKSAFTPAPAPKNTDAYGLTRTPTSKTAPRLSLRPMSRMMPEFMGGGNRRSAGNMLNNMGGAGAAESARNMSPSPQPRSQSPAGYHQNGPMSHNGPMAQNRPTENPFADPQNPFADPEKAQMAASAPAPRRAPAPASNDNFLPIQQNSPVAAPAPLVVERKAAPIDAPSSAPTLPSSSPGPLAGAAAGAIAAGAIAGGAAAAMSTGPRKQESPREQPREFTPGPAPSPAPSTPVSARPPIIAAAAEGAPSSPGPGSAAASGVYRVLMDFVPSMDDELELKTGQLVRMLHEYDDGWVSRLDPNFLCSH